MIISKIPQLAQEKGLTISELGRRMKSTHRTVVKLYYADFTSIHISVLDSLCDALGAQPGDLFIYVPGKPSHKPSLETVPEHTHPRNMRVGQANIIAPEKEKVPAGDKTT